MTSVTGRPPRDASKSAKPPRLVVMLSTFRSASRSPWCHTAAAHLYAPTSIPTARLRRTSCVGCDPRGPRLAASPRGLMLHHRLSSPGKAGDSL
jgi:hypothetical protein